MDRESRTASNAVYWRRIFRATVHPGVAWPKVRWVCVSLSRPSHPPGLSRAPRIPLEAAIGYATRPASALAARAAQHVSAEIGDVYKTEGAVLQVAEVARGPRPDLPARGPRCEPSLPMRSARPDARCFVQPYLCCPPAIDFESHPDLASNARPVGTRSLSNPCEEGSPEAAGPPQLPPFPTALASHPSPRRRFSR